MTGGSRRRSRELALAALFAHETEPELSADEALAIALDLDAGHAQDVVPAPGEDDRPFTQDLVRGVLARRVELDETLTRISRNWRLERMARVDRNVMRLALFELQQRDDIPARVTLNEAVELAKRFGAEDASAFVNGILDRALVELDVQK